MTAVNFKLSTFDVSVVSQGKLSAEHLLPGVYSQTQQKTVSSPKIDPIRKSHFLKT